VGEEIDNETQNKFTYGTPDTLYSLAKFVSRFTEHNVAAAGELFTLPAGSIRLAIGAAYRTEFYSENGNYFQFGTTIYDVSRHVKGAYAEVQLPIFGALNAIPGFQKLTLSVAGRIDNYSDFGNTTNPKYGISWFPIETLELRGAYSTSFRAPATGVELNNAKIGTGSITLLPYPSPDNATEVPVAQLFGGRPNLEPETARNVTVGFDWKPPLVPRLQITFNYYDISYTNQLAVPPNSNTPLSDPALASIISHYPGSAPVQALVNTAVANGAALYDYTGGLFGPNPLASTLYVYDSRTANLSSTKTSGFDIAVRYRLVVAEEHINTSLDVTHIDKFETQITPSAPQASEVNTVGYPARLRVRGVATWNHLPINVSVAANYINSYPDTSSTVPRDVASYTTFDIAARYNFSHGIVASLAAANIFDRSPPFVASALSTALFVGSHYDAANVSPLGRIVNLQISKHW
jgi:iron complex outermembrane receptor protein